MPNSFIAQDAINLWHSPFWRQSDAGWPAVTLPPVSQDELKPGTLSEHALSEVQGYLPFVIQAFLSLEEHQKLYIAAPDRQVAALIWGLAHSLPRSLQQRLTFSTYEHDINKAAVRVVGTCWANSVEQNAYGSTQQELPTECYYGRGLALDCYSGKHSELAQRTQLAAYAQFATHCLITGQKEKLDHLLAAAERMHISDINSFLVVYKFFTADTQQNPLTEQEMSSLLATYELAAELLTQEGVQRSVIELASANPQWWQERGEPAIANLRSPANAVFGVSAIDAVSSLAATAASVLCDALLRSDQPMYNASFRVLRAAAPPESNARPWVYLLHCFSERTSADLSFHPAQAFSWQMRSLLVQYWAYGASYIDDKRIRPWLEVSWSDLEELLSLRIPTRWYTIAITTLLTDSTVPVPPRKVVELLANYPAVFFDALKNLMREPQTQADALRFFALLVEYGYQGKVQLLSVLIDVQTKEPISIDVDSILRTAHLNSAEKMSVLEQYSHLLLPYIPTSSSVRDIIIQYMKAFTLDKLGNAKSRALLQALEHAGSHLPNEVVPLIQNWSLASEGMPLVANSPLLKIEKKHLKTMREAIVSLQLQKQQKYMDSLLESIVYAVQSDDALRCVVESLGQPLVGSRKLLLQQLVPLLASRKMPYALLMPYLRLALEYAVTLRGLEKERFLDPLLTDLLKNVDRETFNTIDSVVNTWPSELHEEWDKHSIDLKPTTFMEKVGSPFKRIFAFRTQPAQLITKQIAAIESDRPAAPPPARTASVSELQKVQHKPSAPSVPPTVAAIVSGQSRPVEISREWLDKVYRVKGQYIIYKMSMLRQNMNKLGVNKEVVLAELDKWQNLLAESEQQGLQRVLEELVDDVLLRQWLSQQKPALTQSIEQHAQRQLSNGWSYFKDCNKEKYSNLRQRMKEVEIKQALLIFTRSKLVDEYLRKESVPMQLNALLKDLRDKQSIQYNEELIFHETETPDFGQTQEP